MRINKQKKNFIVFIISSIFLLGIVYILTLIFGGGLISFLGLKYDSFSSLALFIAIYMIVSFPIDLIVDSFFTIAKRVKRLNDLQHNLLYLSFDIPLNMGIIGIIEYFMKTIDCSMLTAYLFSLVCGLIYIFVDDKFEKNR